MSAFPMSFAQRRLWFLHALDPTGFAHSTGRCFTVSGALDVAALQVAVDTLVARHEALRTSFPTQGNRGPMQWIHPTGQLRIQVIDLPAAQEDEPVVMRRIRALMEEPFDLERGPLIRISLLRASSGVHHLVFSIHLMAADGWGLAVICQELGAAYHAAVIGEPSALPELPVQYADWAAWQTEQLTEERKAALLQWWRKELSDTPLTIDIAHRRPARRQSPQPGRRIHRVMDPSTIAAVGAFATHERQTLFSVLAAACGAVLGRHGGQDRLLLGVAIANRERAEVAHVLGFFVNTVALRIDLTGDPSFAELVQRVAGSTIRAYEHQDLPFDQLVAELRPPRDPHRSPVVQVNFAYHPAGSAGVLSLHGCAVVEDLVDAGTAKFELTIRVEEIADGAMVLWAEFDAEVIDAELVERVMTAYQELLHTAVTHPGIRISELTRPTATEALLVRLFADTLGLANVIVRDNFFALGGHSLQLIELVSRIRARTGQHIGLRELYQAPTVADVAVLLDEPRSVR